MFSGVGCGMVLNGEIYTGTKGFAGEVAVDNYKDNALFSCKMGRDCFLKRWEMDLDIVSDTKALLAKSKTAAERFYELTGTSHVSLDLKSIFSAAKAKHEIAASVIKSAAERLGIKIAYLVNLLNPQIVIIGGGFEEAGEDFLNKVNDTVKKWAFAQATEDLKISFSRLRENAVALGAASLIMKEVFAHLL